MNKRTVSGRNNCIAKCGRLAPKGQTRCRQCRKSTVYKTLKDLKKRNKPAFKEFQELAKVLNRGAVRGEPTPKLDPDYLKVIKAADEPEQPAKG
jgi:hypothetical protein